MNASLPSRKTFIESVINSNMTTETAVLEENDPKSDIPPPDSIQYIIVPLAVFVTVLILSGMVYLMARTKRKVITRMYQRVTRPSDYTMLDASDIDHDDEDNEDDPNECLLAGKLHVDNRYDSYPIHSYNYSHRELYA